MNALLTTVIAITACAAAWSMLRLVAHAVMDLPAPPDVRWPVGR